MAGLAFLAMLALAAGALCAFARPSQHVPHGIHRPRPHAPPHAPPRALSATMVDLVYSQQYQRQYQYAPTLREMDPTVLPADPRLQFQQEILHHAPRLRAAMSDVSNDPDHLRYISYLDMRLREFAEYLRPSGQQQLRLALEVAFLAHLGQKRRSGEPYISHPVEVAIILAKTAMDKESVVSGLLHDTVEDTDLTFEEVESLFGVTVRKIVEGETKVSKLPKMVRSNLDLDNVHLMAGVGSGGKSDEQVENLRSMFIAMAEDWRIVVVKLADRLHNMHTLQHMPLEKRASIARETLEIFAPLAHRLGMWQYKTTLSDLSFSHLFPKEHAELDGYITDHMRTYEDTINSTKATLESMLRTDEWLHQRVRSVTVTGRTKSMYSTWRKMQRHTCGIERINDLVALRVVLHPTGAAEAAEETALALCYHVLGRVHSLFTPLPRTLKDYISSPKPNGYASLHTTVLVGTQPLEIQIRTQEMHIVAEHGAAAHWAYKEKGASLPWLQTIRGWEKEKSAHEFVQLVREELLGTRVFVFTRNGRILNLARGATLADAAEQLSASLRNHIALVNGAPTVPTHELQNGDIVSLELREPLSGRGMLHERAQRYLQHRDADPADPRQKNFKRHWVLCPHCLPLRGDALVGIMEHATQHSTGTIHRAGTDCAALERQLSDEGHFAIEGDEAQATLAQYADEAMPADGFMTAVVVFCRDRKGMLLALSTVFSESSNNIMDVHSETLNPGVEAAFQFTVHVRDGEHLRALIMEVQTVDGVIKVVRGGMEELITASSPAQFWANCHSDERPSRYETHDSLY